MAQDTMTFTRFRGSLQYANEGHRFNGLPIDVVASTLGRTANIGASGVDYDFQDFGTSTWTQSATSGSATLGLTQTDGASQEFGVLRMVNSAGSGDKLELQLRGLSFRYRAGKKMWAGVRWKTDDADLTGMAFGLASSTTSFVAGAQAGSLGPGVDDGIFFWKAATDTTWSFGTAEQSGLNGVGATRVQVNSTGLGAAIVDDTYDELFFTVDQDGNVHAFVDGSEVANRLVGAASIPDDTDLTVSFGFRNGSAVARTVQADWVVALQDS